MSIYKELSIERKELQSQALLPKWVTTNSYQMLKEKYLDKGETLRSRYISIAERAARYMPLYNSHWADKFFQILWDGNLAASTPVLASMGKKNGCPVSCSGGYIGDSVHDFYSSQLEAAMLSKNGFGTSGYLGDIRPRGAPITNLKGGASGVVPVFRDFVQVARDISQGSQRRGAWAGYLPIEHDDFSELLNAIQREPDDSNVGWVISKHFIDLLDAGDEWALDRYRKALKLKMVSGKGYFFFKDKVNSQNPQWYKDKGVEVLASNLCTEIALPSNEEETFTCVLSSLNLRNYDSWKDDDTIFTATVFLHCVAFDFINIGSKIKGLEKAVKFTKNHMALGLGTLGFHSYLQDNLIPFESMEAHLKNIEIFKRIDDESLRASKWLAQVFGECKMTEGYGVANTHRMAVAPNLSSALICGGVSQGIEPVYKNAYVQGTASGEMNRVNPSLLKIMRERGVDSDKIISDIINNNGSVQWVSWLDDHEKEVFKTAFEINQKVIIRLASSRQRYIDQAQSINLFFSADEDEEYISEVHQLAFKDPYIKSLYYIRSESGVQASKGECESCSG
jgi:ribonucleoside-diphosphate reductase alpha chain